jgi:hypothetical protein
VLAIIDELRGYYIKYKRLSTGDSIKVVAIIGTFILSGVLLWLGQPVYAILSAVINSLFAVSELPNIIRRRKM